MCPLGEGIFVNGHRDGGKRDRNRRAIAFFSRGPNVPLVSFDDLLNNGEA
jgi:hypothetical protein